MGRSKIKTTKNIYGHLFVQDRSVILAAVNQAVSRLYAPEDDEPDEDGGADAVAPLASGRTVSRWVGSQLARHRCPSFLRLIFRHELCDRVSQVSQRRFNGAADDLGIHSVVVMR